MPRRDDEYDDDDRRRDDRDDMPPPKKKGMGIGMILLIVFSIMIVCGGLVIGGGIYGVMSIRGSANRMKSSNNMKQMGLAIHNYNDTTNEIPGNTYSKDGKPLLSWRVHILPYIEQDNLYKQFRLDEPWDSPNNFRLLNQMPRIYQIPDAPPSTSQTHYRGFSSKGTIFERKLAWDGKRNPREMLSIQNLPDGSSNTILIVEAGDPVEWTKPDDLDASPGKPFPPMAKFRGGAFQVLMGDGSVRTLKPSISETTFRALVTYNGGEPLPAVWDE